MANYTREKILHVAKLAHLDLPEKEIPERLREFNEIVGYIEKLNGLPTDGIEPTTQVLPSGVSAGTPLADDQPKESFSPEKALENAPARQDNFFQVPRMIGEKE
ncbi:MAG: Asp-tRNA(Asn)/Glu-tRNA(Gln) amidotransferase subunit GatC [Pseudomonadota bacterium]